MPWKLVKRVGRLRRLRSLQYDRPTGDLAATLTWRGSRQWYFSSGRVGVKIPYGLLHNPKRHDLEGSLPCCSHKERAGNEGLVSNRVAREVALPSPHTT
jgi:hypothetical protein